MRPTDASGITPTSPSSWLSARLMLMRSVRAGLCVFFLLALGSGSETWAQSASPLKTAPQCAAAVSDASGKLYACMSGIASNVKASLGTVKDIVRAQYEATCSPYALQEDPSKARYYDLEFCNTLADVLNDAHTTSSDWLADALQAGLAKKYDAAYEKAFKACMAEFDGSLSAELKQTCPNNAISPLYCAVRKTVSSTCANFCDNCDCASYLPAKSYSPPMCLAPTEKIFNAPDVLCPGAEQAAAQCTANCPQGEGRAQCLADCSHLRDTLIFACHGWELPKSKPESASAPGTNKKGSRSGSAGKALIANVPVDSTQPVSRTVSPDAQTNQKNKRRGKLLPPSPCKGAACEATRKLPPNPCRRNEGCRVQSGTSKVGVVRSNDAGVPTSRDLKPLPPSPCRKGQACATSASAGVPRNSNGARTKVIGPGLLEDASSFGPLSPSAAGSGGGGGRRGRD